MRNPIASVLARGVVVLANSARKLQALQLRITAGEVKDDIEHLEPYGFTACPKDGAEALVGFFGDRSHGVVILVADRRFRLQGLKPGEVALYTDQGDSLVFRRGRVIEIETMTLKVKAGESVDFDTPIIRTTGRIESGGDQVAAGISQIEHVHDGVLNGEGSTNKPVGGGA
ncbi:phage baseplate assembly protein V [Pseudomonas asiatica]|uniref:phage baseplate assembly protein V n=1 Tax=Pseudomonas asiatica TaxID=2219225 RepID=UPI002449B3E5|nr:phage baseplate assembly protein V [Pseudomonas asiatica]MDH0132814.1 phage baseplate assembly protein V [Pseudomonas asiatica]